MQRLPPLLFLLIIGISASAQDCSEGAPEGAFNRIVHREFSRILDPKANTNVGNYASLDLGETSATLGASNTFQDSSILSIKVSGGTSDGVAAIWNNRKLSSNFSAGLQYHFLSSKRQSIVYQTDSCAAFLARLAQFRRDSTLKRLELREKRDQKKAQWELRDLNGTVRSLNVKIEREMCILDSLNELSMTDRGEKWQRTLERSEHRIDSLTVEVVFARVKVQNKQVELDRVIERESVPTTAFRKWYTTEYKKIPKVFTVDGVDLAWFSIGYTYSSAKFKLYNDSASYKDQISKASYGSHEWRVQRSWYKRAFNAYDHSYFFSLGISYGISDNHDDLDEVTLEERTQQGPDSLSRTEVAKYAVLKGAYVKNLNRGSVFADAYWFVSRNKSNAIHLFPAWVVQDQSTPRLDLGVGFLAGYLKKDDTSNAINVELFVVLNDLLNGASNETNASQRSDLGLKLTFPINFLQAKQ